MKVAIVGYGHVGKSMHRIFPDAVLYDPPQELGDREARDSCELALVCVPTPSRADSGSCDTSYVLAAVSDIGPDTTICIKSAVPPGTADDLADILRRQDIVASPEYVGEGPTWGIEQQIRPWPYLILGGPEEHTAKVARAFFDSGVYGYDRIYFTGRKEAELTKYMENVWLASQVTFANEFYDIANAVGADFFESRRLWLLDQRTSPSHTFVYADDRGFGGKCLPKELAATIAFSRDSGYAATYLEAMNTANERFKNR